MTPASLDEFVAAQDAVYPAVLSELAAGRKRTHWIWFVFPQIAGLGTSATARRYALASLDEARAYLAHPVLGARLRECAGLLVALPSSDIRAVLGEPDDLKFRSSMTLFEAAAPDEPLFRRALEKFYGGRRDALTLERLRAAG